MPAQSFQCPSCGAPLLPKGNASVIRCPHCHTSVVVPEELRVDSEAAEWTTLVFDNIASNENNWLIGNKSDEYFAPLDQVIAEGRYRWDAITNRTSSLSTAWLRGYQVADFHLIANGKHIVGSKTGSSWGLLFRVQDNQNFYSFRMTDSQLFGVSVVKESEWTNLVDWKRTEVIKPNGVNQLEVVTRDTHFVFLINGEIVSEVNKNDHFGQGLVGLAIEGYSQGEKIVFDFLDFTLRGPREGPLK